MKAIQSAYAIAIGGFVAVAACSDQPGVSGEELRAAAFQGEELRAAAFQGEELQVQELLDAGADVNTTGSEGATALMGAALGGHGEIVRLLLDAGADVNAKIADGAASAMVESGGYTEPAARLKRRGPTYVTALGLAMVSGHTEIATLLEQADGGRRDLMEAISVSDAPWVQRLVDAGANVNATGPFGETALMGAALGGHTEIARLLLDAGAEVNAKIDVYTALAMAESDGHAGEFERLRTVGPRYVTALGFARVGNHTAIATLLEQATGRGDVMEAISEKDASRVGRLIEAGADVNATGPFGSTALTEALRNGNGEIGRLLLEVGADVNATGTGSARR